MKKREAVIATTHRDRHNERFTKGALEGMVSQIKNRYIPMGIEHDPRIPPQGRIVNAHLEKRDDGEYAVVGEIEIFENGDVIPLKDDGRKIPLRILDNDETFCIAYDRGYRNEQDLAKLRELATLTSGHLQEEGKKSVEPISVLTLAATFIAGAIFSGFFNQLGADVYESLKAKLKELFRQKTKSGSEQLLVFQAIIKKDNYFVIVETIITDPNDQDIDFLLQKGLAHLDKIVPHLLENNQDISKYVFECSNEEIRLKFAIRQDAVPTYPIVNQKTLD